MAPPGIKYTPIPATATTNVGSTHTLVYPYYIHLPTLPRQSKDPSSKITNTRKGPHASGEGVNTAKTVTAAAAYELAEEDICKLSSSCVRWWLVDGARVGRQNQLERPGRGARKAAYICGRLEIRNSYRLIAFAPAINSVPGTRLNIQ